MTVFRTVIPARITEHFPFGAQPPLAAPAPTARPSQRPECRHLPHQTGGPVHRKQPGLTSSPHSIRTEQAYRPHRRGRHHSPVLSGSQQTLRKRAQSCHPRGVCPRNPWFTANSPWLSVVSSQDIHRRSDRMEIRWAVWTDYAFELFPIISHRVALCSLGVTTVAAGEQPSTPMQRAADREWPCLRRSERNL